MTDTLVRLAWSPPQVIGMCSYHREVIPVVVLDSLPRRRRGALERATSGSRDRYSPGKARHR